MSATPIYQQKPAQRFTSFPWNRIVIYGCALFISCWSVGPFLWQMSTSLQLDKQLVSGNPMLLPDPITLDHFINIFVAKSFHRYLLNSVIVAGTTTFLCLLFGAIAAFALARLDIRDRFGILAAAIRKGAVQSELPQSEERERRVSSWDDQRADRWHTRSRPRSSSSPA